MLAKILSIAFFVVLYHQEVLCLYFSHSVCLILINTFFFFHVFVVFMYICVYSPIWKYICKDVCV